MTDTRAARATICRDHAYTKTVGYLVAHPIRPDGSIDWDDPHPMTVAEFDHAEQIARQLDLVAHARPAA